MHYETGEVLVRQNELPGAIFLVARDTADVTRTDAHGTRGLLLAGTGLQHCRHGLIADMPALFTAMALTSVQAYRLDKASIAAVMRIRSELAETLEAQARRGSAWIRCEAAAHTGDNSETPGILLTRLRHFLQRLNA